jgi:LDH2 family malate/lactate/ureidoglycolate dehydrogenase
MVHSTTHYVSADNARLFVKDVLRANGVSESHAEIVSRCLVQADLRGVDTHGTTRVKTPHAAELLICLCFRDKQAPLVYETYP